MKNLQFKKTTPSSVLRNATKLYNEVFKKKRTYPNLCKMYGLKRHKVKLRELDDRKTTRETNIA